jgi:hypothetical protein
MAMDGTLGWTYDVFLSHNKLQKPLVRSMVKQWREKGIRVFFDEEQVLGGEPIDVALERAVESSRFVVLLISPGAMESRWVAFERSLAFHADPAARERRLIPVIVDPVDRDKLPGTLRRLSIIDLTDTDSESRQASYRHLLKSLDRPDLSLPWPDERPNPTGKVPGARDALRRAHGHIKVLTDNKEIHDALQELQLKWEPLVSKELRQQDGEGGLLMIDSYMEINFDGPMQEARDAIARLRMDTVGVRRLPNLDWFDSLEACGREIREGIRRDDRDGIKRAIARAKSILDRRLPDLNIAIKETAHALEEMNTELQRAAQTIIDAYGPDGAGLFEVRSLQDDLTKLRELLQRLVALVEAHDHWQEIDRGLRAMAGTLRWRDFSPEELEVSWNEVRNQAEALPGFGGDSALESLRSAMADLDAELRRVLNGRPSERLADKLVPVAARVGGAFMRTDKALKAHCRSLRGVGDSISRALEVS